MFYTDQTGRTIEVKKSPQRIISLVPSQSEFLWDIGLQEELVGITKFCIHPQQMFTRVERVGGTKELNLEKIRFLKPDLIIGNKEENDKLQIELLQQEFPVWMSDIYTLNDAINMMDTLGSICGKKAQAEALLNELKGNLPEIKNCFNGQTVAYFIWNKPYMLAAGNTFINDVITYLGLRNALACMDRYPELSVDDLKSLNPEVCFLSSEPYPFSEKHAAELSAQLPDSKIVLVDGEMFSWYGSRLLKLPAYIKSLRLFVQAH